MANKTFKIQINGQVQGVGFRPFIFNLANQYNLVGTVSNNIKGVVIMANTTSEKIADFVHDIFYKKPVVAYITTHSIEEVAHKKFIDFKIISSEATRPINIPLTPDFSICDSCKIEIRDSKNRRFGYPFTTCVHCGPRYAITSGFPFDRIYTSLTSFTMCADCQLEYTSPSDRRFHSQTNSCKSCGINLQLVEKNKNCIEVNSEKIIKKTASLISNGYIVAIKNTNGYLLCCDATNKRTIKQLRLRKQRPNKPFAVLYNSIERIEREFDLNVNEQVALQSSITPIVILKNTKSTKIAASVIAPNLNHTGVALPSSSLLDLLMQECKNPIIATSGNIHGSPIIAEVSQAEKSLSDIADYFLHHDLDIQFPQDDSVIKFANDQRIILRRSRGFAPNYLNLNPKEDKPILAMGAHLKSTFTFIPNTHTYISQYFGNLDNYDVFEFYKKTLTQYFQLFKNKPQTILIDKHPQYQSSQLGKSLAKQWNLPFEEIQHHKAHFASVLGEHNLFKNKEKILGVVWDGNGFGEDGHIWGGEFFVYENHQIQRRNHFEYFNWIINDKMAQEPRLSLLSLLNDENKMLIKNKFSSTQWKIYIKTMQNNTLKTSSVGRIFDAVAAALDLIDFNTFEGEAAMLIENCASGYVAQEKIDFLSGVEYEKIPSKFIINTIFKLYKQGVSRKKLTYGFIITLAKIIIREAKKNNINTIACSGGVFQNSLLISILNHLTSVENINLKINTNLSSNDENISFGQLTYHQNIKPYSSTI